MEDPWYIPSYVFNVLLSKVDSIQTVNNIQFVPDSSHRSSFFFSYVPQHAVNHLE